MRNRRLNKKKALLKLNFSCNNRCVFCHAIDNLHYPGDETRFAIWKMRRAKALGVETVVFSGGESTVRQDFFLLVRAALHLGLNHGVITNGRMLSYPDFAKKYLSYKPEYIYISLHGARKKTHNRIVLASAFDQVVKGLRNISRQVPVLTVNAVVTPVNVKELKEIVDLVLPFAPLTLKFSYVEPKGEALRHFDDVMIPIHEAAHYVNEAIAYGERVGKDAGLQLGCENFVPCLIENFPKYNADLFTDNFVYMSESHEASFFPVDYGDRTYLPACSDCSLKESCPGLFKAYVENTKEEIRVRPVKKKIPTGLSYISLSSFPRYGKSCPIEGYSFQGLSPLSYVFLQEGERISLCRTGALSLNAQRLREMKLEAEQLYLDLTDFAQKGGFKDFEDYKRKRKKLRLKTECARCPKLAACPATFEVAETKNYGAVEQRVREILSRLEGNVLDVGCGRFLYDDILRSLMEQKKIRYLGVDPEPQKLNGFPTVQRRIEEFHSTPDLFDAVLFLRSYNHLADLKRAFDVVFRGLKWGGEILIVENGPFLLIRKSEDGNPSDTNRKFEHYRNHSSCDALHFLEQRYNFSILEHIPLQPEHENQWLLRLKKEKLTLLQSACEKAFPESRTALTAP